MLIMWHLCAVAALSTRCRAGSWGHPTADIPSCIVKHTDHADSYPLLTSSPSAPVRCSNRHGSQTWHTVRHACLGVCTAPVPGLGVLLLADTNGLTDGMPGGSPD